MSQSLISQNVGTQVAVGLGFGRRGPIFLKRLQRSRFLGSGLMKNEVGGGWWELKFLIFLFIELNPPLQNGFVMEEVPGAECFNPLGCFFYVGH